MPLHDENERFYGYIGSAIDITERKQAQQLLQDKERMLSESQHAARVGSWSADLATGRISYSDEVYRIYGITPQTFEHSTQAFFDLIHPDDCDAMKTWISDCLAEKLPRELDFRIVLTDGSVRFIRGSGAIQYDDGHRPLRMVGTMQDVTERKQAEQVSNQLKSHD